MSIIGIFRWLSKLFVNFCVVAFKSRLVEELLNAVTSLSAEAGGVLYELKHYGRNFFNAVRG